MMLSGAMSQGMIITCAVLCGCVLDLIFADPVQIPHPVVLMGKCISSMESWLRRIFPKSPRGEFAGGVVLAAALPIGVFAASFAVCALSWRIHPVLFFIVESIWCAQALAARGLADEAEAVRRSLRPACAESVPGQASEPAEPEPGRYAAYKERAGERHPDGRTDDDIILDKARAQVSRIVGRDTDSLDEAGIIRACVETVAENSSDGVAAPLLYMLIGGAPLALAYKAVNTMDSMVGYKNEQYMYFGRAAARLDDIANFIPSRITAMCWIAAAFLNPSTDGKNAWRIFRRDRYKHSSPNSAQTESACAGALHIRLAGPASYFGSVVMKPWIGDDDRPVEPGDISLSVRLMWLSAALVLAAGTGIRLICLAKMH